MSIQRNQRTCKWCKQKFTPERQKQTCCSIECAEHYGKKVRAKSERIADLADRKVVKAKLDSMKTRPELIKELGIAFRGWVRARDEGKPCISCDKPLLKLGKIGGDYDAGHYRSVGSAKHLEFDERNVHGQCKYCNDQLKSNPQGYRPRLIARIGIDAVLALESDQEPRKYSKEELRQMKAKYTAMTKELKK